VKGLRPSPAGRSEGQIAQIIDPQRPAALPVARGMSGFGGGSRRDGGQGVPDGIANNVPSPTWAPTGVLSCNPVTNVDEAPAPGDAELPGMFDEASRPLCGGEPAVLTGRVACSLRLVAETGRAPRPPDGPRDALAEAAYCPAGGEYHGDPIAGLFQFISCHP